MSCPTIDLHIFPDYILTLVDLSYIAWLPNGKVDTDSVVTTDSGCQANHYLYQGA